MPSIQPNVVGPFCGATGHSAPLLDGLADVFQATVQKAGGNLYGVLPLGAKDGNGLARDVLAWFILQPTLTSPGSLTANIIAQGYVVPPNGYSVSFPAFAVNKAGVGVIGMSITNPDPNVAGGFPSAGFIQFSGFPRGNIIVTGQGATSDDGFSGCVGHPPPAFAKSADGAIMAPRPSMRPPDFTMSPTSTFRTRQNSRAALPLIGVRSSPECTEPVSAA